MRGAGPYSGLFVGVSTLYSDWLSILLFLDLKPIAVILLNHLYAL
jgi:hypothetical protein